MSIAAICGVSVSAAAAQRYGFSLSDPRGSDPENTDPKNIVGPDRFLRPLLDGYDPHLHGEVRLPFMSFNGIAPTAQWVAQRVSEVRDR